MGVEVDKRVKFLWQLGVVVVIAAAWQFLPKIFDISPLVLPTLSDSIASLWSPLTGEGTLWSNTLVTLKEIAGAFLIAAVVGIVVGLVVGTVEPLRKISMPFLMAAFAVPIMVLIPLFLVSLGLGVSSKVAFGALYAVFPVLFNTVVGVSSVQPIYYSVAQVYGLSRREVMTKIVLRSAARDIMNGIQNAVAISIIAVISIEMFGSVAGLGYLIHRAGQRMRIDETYGLILVVLILAVVLLGVVKAIGRSMNVRLEVSIE